MGTLRVGIIACGSIARAHARGWRGIDGVDLVAIADSNPEAAHEFGTTFEVAPEKRYADFREMLDREKLDIVSVASWHLQHAEMTIAAAARKPRAILCEKPMATSLGEADAMLTACKRNGVKLAIGHMRRFYSGWEAARRLVADGAIGEPRRAWIVVLQGLLNWGTHAIDGLRFALGDPPAQWVMGAVERRTDRYERAMRIEDACLGLVQFTNGVQAVVENDLTPRGSINFQIIGSEGTLDVDENRVRLMNGSTGGWQVLDNPQNDPFIAQAQGLVDWIEGKGEDYRGEGSKARATLEIMMAIYESVRINGVVRLPMQTRQNPLDLLVESGRLPVEYPGAYDIRSFLVRGERMSWV
ncbi:MAG: Gfo/Idh/MocA family oxidoreductase [Chloroflexi bacterium]|nr:Gfo/Idh/MocA family oxidoreductase [Chloroflexota bacterium]